jgi:hypothetical protein
MRRKNHLAIPKILLSKWVKNSTLSFRAKTWQGAKLNSTLAKHDNEQPTNTSDEGSQYKNLGHYLKVSLVLTMQSYILERELLKLSEKELEERMLSVSSKHELLWEAEQARGKHS